MPDEFSVKVVPEELLARQLEVCTRELLLELHRIIKEKKYRDKLNFG